MEDPTSKEPADLRIERASRENDNRNISPTDMLELALRDLRALPDDKMPNRAILILLKDDEEKSQFWTSARRSNLNYSRAVTLLEAMKHRYLKGLVEEQ